MTSHRDKVCDEITLYHSDIALDWLTLAFLPGLGRGTLCRLAASGRPPADILAAPELHPDIAPRLLRILADHSLQTTAHRTACRQLERLRRAGISLCCYGDDHYPGQLLSLNDAPTLLFFKGDLSCLSKPAVALVGSRAATSYGRDAARSLARDLARTSVTVVSGVALGIDTAAHQGALHGNGLTAGVLGCGIDIIYPRTNRDLYRQIEQHGVLISEYPCGTRPDGFRFPERNRIISGLVQGVVVVEATLKSGSLITARLALDQGREVFAVPGRIDSSRSEGTHSLIRQGAVLVRDAEDILLELGLPESPVSTVQSPAAAPSLSDEEQQLLQVLDVYPVDIDSLQRTTRLDPGCLLNTLLGLELKGLVRQLPGQLYEKKRPE